ncbi:MAG: toprim domain-containing protein [Gammaproteobacteria bacterium]|nr:toprim domain-containing protein [Gammaproteobacteria bacterium]
MASILELKERITDLHDVAERLGLVRPGGTHGNYRSPHHDDKSPSLQVGDGWFKDYSRDMGGDVINLVEYVHKCDTSEAVKWLHEQYGIPFTKPDNQRSEPLTLPQSIANNCTREGTDWKDQVARYLVDERGIDRKVVEKAISKKAIGWNVWTSHKVEAGKHGHGGPAAAFIVRDPLLAPGITNVVAVDLRYEDPSLNGGTKTQCQGEKYGYPWFMDYKEVKKAHTIVLVESPINALSVASCPNLPGYVAVAVRGAESLAKQVDLSLCKGKKVIIAMDNDKPDEKGYKAGYRAAWILNERLTAMNVASFIVDQGEWEENDLNDILKEHDAEELGKRLQILEPWAIQGLYGDYKKATGKQRVYLPLHDSHKYWLYRTKDDFTTYITKIEKQSNEDGSITELPEFADLCGFRVAGLSRVTVSSVTATMTGEEDAEPRTLFAVAIQSPRHGPVLQRRVFDDETLHNVDQWKKFGPVFSPAQFSRLLSIWERAAHIGARTAINFVGVAWRDGQLVVNEGPDTYFVDPKQQCPYYNLVFPNGKKHQAKQVIDAYMATFKGNPATQLLVWALGGHLKAVLGFWPHMQLQADKGAGKSTIIKRLERTIAFKMFSSQALKTEFRILTSISSTSHPVGWEEFSTLPQALIDRALGILQQCYNYNQSTRGSDMKEFNESAPVLLAGEDVPVQTITGKICRATLKADNQGTEIPDILPRFPVRQWLEFLTSHSRDELKELFRKNLAYCQEGCRATGKDAGARRMVENYAAVLTSWALLTRWLDLPNNYGQFVSELLQEMNDHISETSADREPWIWIMEVFLNELNRGKYSSGYKIDYKTQEFMVDEEKKAESLYLAFMPSQLMHHIRTDPGLRATWDGLPVKSARTFKKQLIQAGVVMDEDISYTHRTGRQTHAIALSAVELAKYGLHVPEPDDGESRE